MVGPPIVGDIISLESNHALIKGFGIVAFLVLDFWSSHSGGTICGARSSHGIAQGNMGASYALSCSAMGGGVGMGCTIGSSVGAT